MKSGVLKKNEIKEIPYIHMEKLIGGRKAWRFLMQSSLEIDMMGVSNR